MILPHSLRSTPLNRQDTLIREKPEGAIGANAAQPTTVSLPVPLGNESHTIMTEVKGLMKPTFG